jgi:hypothetical protein
MKRRKVVPVAELKVGDRVAFHIDGPKTPRVRGTVCKTAPPVTADVDGGRHMMMLDRDLPVRLVRRRGCRRCERLSRAITEMLAQVGLLKTQLEAIR